MAPHIWTGMTAFVRRVITDSMASGSRQSVSSISEKTGIAPASKIPSMVAINVKGGTITSSPAPIPHAASAIRSAAVPLELRWQYPAPIRFASSDSNAFAFQFPFRTPSKP